MYENPSVREHAAQFCDLLSEQSARLEVTWWSFALLENAIGARDAAQRAAAAELVVFAFTAGGDLPAEVKRWVENWLGRRSEHEGAIIGLAERETGPGDIASPKEIYLRHVAHRAGMDYLAHATATASRALPDSLDSFNARAVQMTAVLDQILRTRSVPPPPR